LQHIKANDPIQYSLYLNQREDLSNQSELLRNYFFPNNIKPSQWIKKPPTRQYNYYENINSFWEDIFGSQNIISKVYEKNNLSKKNIISDFIKLIDSEINFPKEDNIRYLENKTNAYRYNKPGFLLNDEICYFIKHVFLESNILYANKYLDERNSKLLLTGF